MADRAYIEHLTRELTEKGLLIEAGFAGLRLIAIPLNAPPEQLAEMRMAFFAGAQHLFGSIMTTMDPGEDPTDADMARLDKIDSELRRFGAELELRAARTRGTA